MQNHSVFRYYVGCCRTGYGLQYSDGLVEIIGRQFVLNKMIVELGLGGQDARLGGLSPTLRIATAGLGLLYNRIGFLFELAHCYTGFSLADFRCLGETELICKA